ncbi:Protein required for meiotic chromosome segregation, partial [Globisporangium splendens]
MADAVAQPPSNPETEIHIIEELASEPLLNEMAAKREERHLSSSVVSLAVQDDQWSFTPPVSPRSGASLLKPGHCRYLRGTKSSDVEGALCDFAIVTHRKPADKKLSIGSSPEKKHDGPETRIIDKLVAHGLDVDIIEGDFSRMVKGASEGSKYFVLLVSGNEEALTAYGRRLKFQTWLRSGNSREVDALVKGNPIMMPADRIQVIDHIIREGAKITTSTPCVHSVFPVHDPKTNEYLLKTFIQSPRLELVSKRFLAKMRAHFGEKVAYYFAFMDCYNKSLLPIAILGVLLTCFRNVLGTAMYMRVLVVWALLVSVVWSYWVLKKWSRRNNELNFQWENNVDTKTVVYYRNPRFRGESFINPVTGLPDQSYASWKRYPKYVAVLLFMILQISLMMLVIACWITVFEVIQVRYPDKGLFSAQWFYILGGGICYGLFVDVVQWKLLVTKAACMFTEWENWKTIEQFEKSMVRKLFLMDFLNYYTWFFLLAFVYVIPGAGDRITNFLNSMLWKDPSNCCFGPYLNYDGDECNACPPSWHSLDYQETRCIPCKGWVTFDIHHLDLETLFLTPIIITQGLNLLIAVLVPWINRRHHEQKLKVTDRKAMELVKAKGERQIIADMAYRDEYAQLTNLSKARFFENDDNQIEQLNAKARAILFESEQDDYDPYDDYHDATVQFGFVVMFSMLWPLMPVACMIVNALKTRGDGFRLCCTTKRPFPRKAGGIGEWKAVLHVLACLGVTVNIGLVFISTGAIEFFSPQCSKRIAMAMGNDFSHFRFGPDFSCFSATTRVVMILVCEHIIFVLIWIFWRFVRSVPPKVELAMLQQEFTFKCNLYKHAVKKACRSSMDGSSSLNGTTTSTPPKFTPAQRRVATAAGTPQRSPVVSKYAATQSPMTFVSSKKKGDGTKEELAPLLRGNRKLAQAWDAVKSNSSSHHE